MTTSGILARLIVLIGLSFVGFSSVARDVIPDFGRVILIHEGHLSVVAMPAFDWKRDAENMAGIMQRAAAELQQSTKTCSSLLDKIGVQDEEVFSVLSSATATTLHQIDTGIDSGDLSGVVTAVLAKYAVREQHDDKRLRNLIGPRDCFDYFNDSMSDSLEFERLSALKDDVAGFCGAAFKAQTCLSNLEMRNLYALRQAEKVSEPLMLVEGQRSEPPHARSAFIAFTVP